MGEICEVCGREVGWPSGSCPDGACPAKWSPHCLRTGYEREKAARASLEARLAVAENERNAYRSQNTDDANAIASLEQQVVELREALGRVLAVVESIRDGELHWSAFDSSDYDAALANHQPEPKK